MRFATVEDYSNYLLRLQAVPKLVDDTIEALRMGLREGRTPPQVVLGGVNDQILALLDTHGQEVLSDPLLKKMLATFAQADHDRLVSQWYNTGQPAEKSALKKLQDFWNNIYLPGCRKSIAAIDWPDGGSAIPFVAT